ncbi:hypothetical protein RG963_07100 [Methanosarcina sp. Z-7115]|uniref:Uncharacterized protein n=1 Tax=Methanosarcina baikalica TaxID=3073890 RepID=A0ABU2D0Q7_9EURY|nr:hypothetical protein [Methanosarcina sp. Z-7115]MDR7665549.1 hypothetical protein [Methanosarcina sp. Z-7115]
MIKYLDIGIAVGSAAAQAKAPSLSATVSFLLWGCSLLLQNDRSRHINGASFER